MCRHVDLQRTCSAKCLAIALGLVAFSLASAAEPVNHHAKSMTPFWSRSIPSNVGIQGTQPGLVLADIVRSSKAPAVLLAVNDGRPSLLVGPNESGPGRLVPLPISGERLRLTQTDEESLWVGGLKNSRYALPGGHLSDGYLAKLNRRGQVAWERTFGVKSQRTIDSLTPLQSGDVAVVGRDNESTWLAQISSDGKIVWERYFGLGKGASVTSRGDKIVVAALDVDEPNINDGYREDVVVWTFDGAGELLDRRIVRQGINRERGAYFSRLLVERSGDDIYVVSAWSARDTAKPIEVAKLDAQARLSWRKELSESVLQRSNRGYVSCSAGGAVLTNGDPVIACSILGRLTLYRLQSQTGDSEATAMSLPDCHQGSSPALFLSQIAASTVWIFGSRPENVQAASCTWLGEIPLRQ
jgi:hypothetical protein